MIAWAVLAIASVALPASSPAQTREAADAAEALAPADGSTEGAEPTWDAVVQAIIGELPPESVTPQNEGEAAEPRAAADPADEPSDEPSDEAVDLVEWVLDSRDNGGLPFIVIDKMAATLFLFDPEGELLGATPALLGVANGDDSVPGIGDRELSAISPEERTTPAGRFLARYGTATGGRTVLWVDYSTSLALHAVVTANRRERRLQRLRSPSPDDNRITYGCINVPAPFYRNLVQPHFSESGGIVYILPETRPLEEVFPSLRGSVVLAPGKETDFTG